jgi:hypothetical protein
VSRCGLAARFLATTLAVFALAACGGGGDDDDAEPTADGNDADVALAESVLLVLNDYPTGWTQDPEAEEEAEDPLEACGGPWDGETARVSGPTFFAPGEVPSINQTVVVFATAEQARAALAATRARFECGVDRINEGALDDDEFTAADASLSDLSWPAVGDQTAAFRLELELTARSDSNSTDAFFDAVGFTVGRILVGVTGGDDSSPIDAAILEDVVAKALAKAEEALAD